MRRRTKTKLDPIKTSVTMRLELDEMGDSYQDKRHEIRLWWAIDDDRGEVVAFWFGRREHKHVDTLLELRESLNLVLCNL